MRQSNSAAGYRTKTIVSDVGRYRGSPLGVALALHLLLDRVFTARTQVWIVAGEQDPRRVDLTALDPDIHTLADLHQIGTQASRPTPTDRGGHLIVLGEDVGDLAGLLHPVTVLHVADAVTLSVADHLAIDDDVTTTLTRLWALLAECPAPAGVDDSHVVRAERDDSGGAAVRGDGRPVEAVRLTRGADDAADQPIQQIVASERVGAAAPLAPPPLFVTRFLAVTRRHPDRIAIETPTRDITYAELDATANAIAAELTDRGLRRGDVLLLIPRRDEQLVATVVAALKLGVALAIANPTGPPAYLRECARAAQADLIVNLAGVDLPDALTELPIERAELPIERAELPIERAELPIERAELPIGPAELPIAPVELATAPVDHPVGSYDQERLLPNDCAVVTFTSGTSGTPRAVRGRYSSLTYFFDWMDRHLGPLRDARFGMCSALGHDPLQRDILTPLYLGATLVIPDADDAASATLPRWLDEARVQVVCVNPSAIALLAAEGRVLEHLRTVFLVGSALTRTQVGALAAVAPMARIVNLYGSTETQRAVAFFDITTATGELPEIIPVGQGMADVDVLVLTARHRICVPWQTGQIAVRSPHIALGYVGDAELSAAKFRTGLPAGAAPDDHTPTYLTGDIGYLTPRYGVHYGGRADNQVKINGFRVELDQITACCLAMPAVRDAATRTFEFDGVPALAVFLVPDAPAIRFDPTAFRAALAERLPAHMLPHRVITLPELPMTRNQKIDTEALGAYLADPKTPPANPSDAADVVHDYLRGLTGDATPDLSLPLAELGMDSLRFAALLSRLPATARTRATTALSAAELLADMEGEMSLIEAAATGGDGSGDTLDLRALLGPITRITETTIEFTDRTLDHLCSNSYLGLSSDPRLRAGLLEFAQSAGSLGSHGSPEINGYTQAHERLTRSLRTLLGGDGVTLYSSAYLANISAIPAIAGPGDQLFADERMHRSVRDGCLLSGAELHLYRHNDPNDLDDLLRRTPVTGRRVIVSEALFGVDGDIADLPGLVACARDRQAILFLDEASSIGQLGAGRGIEAHYDMPGTVDLRVGSLGKALAGGGGFVACAGEFVDVLRRHRGATFSTTLSPLAAHLAADAVDILRAEGAELTARLHANRTRWAEALRDGGIDTGPSTTAIVPLYPPGAGDTARWFHAALDAGIFTLPLAASWTSRPGGGLRTTVTAVHDPDALAEIADRLIRSLALTIAR
ncbi:aminotransferase class I/II-fold pyridoxal phosphate-dependent enzyme [Nocardia sp. NPDC052566]|uniref:aminotransferase class I/II-fold pyridoxal phosphate-dependent enzyme n=1 Tax=Nocardia sp. NPDC052566 TaxID=3364330 RepID=UPI0037C561F3